MAKPGDEVDMSDRDAERLCAGYRIAVQDPPYDAVDAAVMRGAARQTRRFPVRRLAYGIAATLLAALGLAAWMRSPALWRRPAVIPTRTTTASAARPSSGRTSLFNDYLSNAMLDSGGTGFLQQAAAVSTPSTGPSCGTAAAVDLNAPGALGGVRVGSPGDYVKIMRIIAGVTRHPEMDVARWISATFQAGNVSYQPLWRTSLPPQRRLSFCLGSVSYDVVLTITVEGARVSPTDYYKNSRKPLRMR
jgi:hypothetical protein